MKEKFGWEACGRSRDENMRSDRSADDVRQRRYPPSIPLAFSIMKQLRTEGTPADREAQGCRS